MPIMARMKDELTSIHLPFDFDSNGNALTAWSIDGNGQQTGTPTPDAPIMPTFCGVRTGNLFDPNSTRYHMGKASNNQIGRVSNGAIFYIKADADMTYTIKLHTSDATFVRLYLSDAPIVEGVSETYNVISESETVKNPEVSITNTNHAYLWIQTGGAWYTEHGGSSIMLNTGSTAKPYEPYGWAEKITSAGQTQTVYLGQVQTLRRIKKLVLTGDEPWLDYNSNIWSNVVDSDSMEGMTCICTHLVSQRNSGIYISNGSTRLKVYASSVSSVATTANEWVQYLQQQYAAGTPVTVWYVLAEPETGVINEPLAKIGTYADELHSTDAGITIPTVRGSNTLTVDTDLQPSAMSIRGTGLYHMVTKTPAPLINKEVKHVLDASGNLVYKSPAYYSWTGIREIVRAGKAPQYYPLGSIIYDNFDPSTGTAFQVVAYDKHFDPDLTAQGHTHSMTLAELKITDNVQFCSVQSMLVVETAMPAGTYRFTIPNYDATYGGNKTYVFTTTQQIPVGGCVVLNWQYQQQPQSVSTYATQTDMTALDSNKALTVWDGSSAATDIGTVKLSMSDPDSTYGKLNHIHRARYGSNNYYCSGIRQLINSDANSNAWWQPMDMFDRPYSGRSLSGKLYRLREDMVNVLVTTQIESIANTVFETTAIDGTTFTLGTKYSMRDKCFLLSPNEVNLNEDTSVGSILDYYVGANNAKRIKYRKDNGNAQHWWLRTPYPSYARNVRHVHSSGALNNDHAHYTYGCVAACTIQ